MVALFDGCSEAELQLESYAEEGERLHEAAVHGVGVGASAQVAIDICLKEMMFWLKVEINHYVMCQK